MKNDLHLEKRMQKDLIVSDQMYLSGLFDVTIWLLLDLKHYLKEENRFFGIMPVHFENIEKAISHFNRGCTEDDCDIYGKIFYLFKPIIMKEFYKLDSRKLSKADCLIVMCKRILDLVETVGKECEYIKIGDIRKVNLIITKMYDRIRNRNKQLELKYMISQMKEYMEEGRVGKSQIDEFSISSEISKRESYKQQPIVNNGTILEETKGTELWNESL